jgi:TetR/AcrR family transcriptional repressor of nem operon
MPRTRGFDPDVALRQAMELFWDRGYAATSMADLVEHLGVARAGIYSVFGGKRELYLKALQRYSNDKDPVLVGLLGRPGSALGNVRDLVEIYAAEVVGDERRRGCLVVNSAVELSARDAAVAALIGRSWEVLEAALTSALVRAKQDGELSPEKDPQALARLLVVVLQGLRVLGRAEPRPSLVRDAVDQVSAALS